MNDKVEETDVSSCEKIKSAKDNRYILGPLTSFSVQSGKINSYEKVLVFSLSPIPLNIGNADGSRWKRKKSKLKNVIIESTNLQTDEKL